MMSRALKFLAGGPHLHGTNFDFQMEESSIKGKLMALPHKSEEYLGKVPCWQLVLLLPLGTPLMSTSYCPGTPASELC